MDGSYRPIGINWKTDVVYTKQFIARCIIGTTIYWVLSPLFLMLSDVVPEFDTKSTLFQSWYFRGSVNTTWFPLAQFISFMALMIFGWTFVNWVTLKRKDPFMSGNKTHKDFKIMLMTAPLIFIFSGIIVMRQPHDLSGYCLGADKESHVHMLRSAHGHHADWHASSTNHASGGSDLLWLHTI